MRTTNSKLWWLLIACALLAALSALSQDNRIGQAVRMYHGTTAALPGMNALNTTGGDVRSSVAIGQFDDSSPTSITENRFGNLRISANRNLYVTLRDAAGNERGLNIDASGNLGIASNSAVNVAQINGVTPLMGNGATGTGSPRVTIANDSTAIAGWGLGAIGSAPPTGMQQIAGITSGATGGLMAAFTKCDTQFNIQQTANAQIITGVSGRRIYICSLNITTATAQNVAVVAGTGSVCATTTVAVPGTSGGATAATGWNWAANSGIVIGGGFDAIAKTTVNGDNVCVFQSGSGQLSGGGTAAIY